ncbi:hypothetical protein ACWC2K_19490 [Streptomyces chattanoogensis]
MDNKIWVFTATGGWRQTADPLTPHRHLGSFDDELKAAGYGEGTSFPPMASFTSSSSVCPSVWEAMGGLQGGGCS